jgi:hypothetical protein
MTSFVGVYENLWICGILWLECVFTSTIKEYIRVSNGFSSCNTRYCWNVRDKECCPMIRRWSPLTSNVEELKLYCVSHIVDYICICAYNSIYDSSQPYSRIVCVGCIWMVDQDRFHIRILENKAYDDHLIWSVTKSYLQKEHHYERGAPIKFGKDMYLDRSVQSRNTPKNPLV